MPGRPALRRPLPGSERRLVAEAAAVSRLRCPRIVGCAAATATVPSAATGTALAGSPAGPDDLGRGVAQRRADLVDLYLVDSSLLAFLGLVRPLPQPA